MAATALSQSTVRDIVGSSRKTHPGDVALSTSRVYTISCHARCERAALASVILVLEGFSHHVRIACWRTLIQYSEVS